MNSSKLMVHPSREHPYTTVKKYDPAVKAKIYDDFMNTDKDLGEIAIEHGVDRSVIATWSKEGGWLERRKAHEEELMRVADAKYRQFVQDNKIPILRRQVRISEKLENAIEQVVEDELKNPTGKDGGLNDMKLKRMAEAMAAVSGVSAKAIGLADTIVQNNGGSGGKVPLVAIGIGPQLPGERTQEPTINVSEVSYEGNP